MSTLALPQPLTEVFSPRLRRPSSSQTVATSDVLAKRDRLPDAQAKGQHHFDLVLPSGETVELSYTADKDLPAWVRPVLEDISERWGMYPGWDTYDARPTDVSLVASLLTTMSALMQDGVQPPQVFPLADGGVQAEWHLPGRDLELEISLGAAPSFYYYDEQSGEEEEGAIQDNLARVRELVHSMR